MKKELENLLYDFDNSNYIKRYDVAADGIIELFSDKIDSAEEEIKDYIGRKLMVGTNIPVEKVCDFELEFPKDILQIIKDKLKG